MFQPFRLSDEIQLSNRILMAPMTRGMADRRLVPHEAAPEYYARRAEAGLIVTEGTIIRRDSLGCAGLPGIWTDDQIVAWSRVASRVHDRGGQIFLQIWHVGRVGHPYYLKGEPPIAPSAVPLSGHPPGRKDLEYGTPRALQDDEIPVLVEDFARAAESARLAGFDGVEIHAANGYLLDQFLHYSTNLRQDAWGGTPEKMSRMVLEVADAVAEKIGPGRVGVRLSPGAFLNLEGDPRDGEVFRYLLPELERRRLAYVHGGIFDDSQRFPQLDDKKVSEFLRAHYQGTLVGNGGYLPDVAATAISEGRFDLVAMGRPFLANPDLMSRLREGEELRSYDVSMLGQLL